MEDNDFSDDDNWSDDEPWQSEVDCLFCPAVLNTMENALHHCNEIHKINFSVLKSKFSMDCYSFIKFVNYIRTSQLSPEKILNIKIPTWDDEKYLKPVKESDLWLTFDFEEYFDSQNNSMITDTDNAIIDSSQGQSSQLQIPLQQKEQQVAELTEQLIQMKEFVHKMLNDDASTNVDRNCSLSKSDSYFESYNHVGIHYDMLSDEVRTLSYKTAILENKSIFSDKIVLDLGCGTGILSMFAASAGSKKVYAVDNSDIAYSTVDILRENNLQDIVEVVKSRIESDNLSIEPVDVIISEWMGYFLLFEGMLDSLIFAREHYLKPGGIILPDRCDLYLCAASDLEGHKKYVEFWTNVYGYSMSCMQNEVLKDAVIEVVPADKIVTSVANISSFDLYETTIADTDFTSSFELHCKENADITEFVGYFDSTFNLEKLVQFSTGPFSLPTHWKQSVFYIKNPISCKKGETIQGNIICSRNSSNNRSLLVTITIKDQNYVYNLR